MHRLAATSREISEELDDFQQQEVRQYCIHLHIRIAVKLASTEINVHSIPNDETLDPDPFVDILSTSPFLAVVYDGTTYGFISCTQAAARKCKCSHCRSHPTCDHISFLKDWCDISDDLIPQVFLLPQELETCKSISHVKTPHLQPEESALYPGVRRAVFSDSLDAQSGSTQACVLMVTSEFYYTLFASTVN